MKSVITLLFIFFVLVVNAQPVSAINASQDEVLEQTLSHLVNEQRMKAGLIGLGVMVMQNGEIITSAVSGERKKNTGVLLTDKDRWHIGSITKSITATMIARLVERGELNWDTSIEDVFHDTQDLHRSWGKTTLQQLLTHTSGAPSNFPFMTNFKHPPEGSERMAARESAVVSILRKPPESEPGSTFVYSNVGYTIAGVIAEKITGLPWEELIRQEIFRPLQIRTGGFGPPKDNGDKLSQPRGHSKLLGITIAAETDDDNSPIMGPAGTIHMTLADLITHANDHLQGANGRGSLLTDKTYQHLHSPVLNGYAFGWVVSPHQDWARGPVLWHNGSNTMWYALVAIMPKLNATIAITSNDGNIVDAELSAWEIIKYISMMLKTGGGAI